ncbi:MAG: type IV pilin [DPANN group archaeon]|nr:type IV pilin [DPANN group archaeon]
MMEKGITEVIGIVLLVAVAVILVVIVSLFFIGFTRTQSADVQKSAPQIQVMSASFCKPSLGLVRVANELQQDIPFNTLAEIRQGARHYAFARTIGSSIPAESSAEIGFEYNSGDNPPFSFAPNNGYTVTFTSGPAKGQSVSFFCSPEPESLELSIDAARDILLIKAPLDLKGNETQVSCNTTSTTGADLFEVYAAFTKQGTGSDKFCINKDLASNKKDFQEVSLLKCNGTTCETFPFEPGAVYTIVLNESIQGNANDLEGRAFRISGA